MQPLNEGHWGEVMVEQVTSRSDPNTSGSAGYWQLVGAGEPYRLLFVAGTFLGIVGVSLWPAYVWGLLNFYPGQVHARIMIEGFLSCFVIGFLGTALPRLLEVRRMRLGESLTWTAALVAGSVCHWTGNHLEGDFVFTVTLLIFLGSLAARFRHRRDTPPPGFVLVLMGLLCALAGGTIQVLTQLIPGWVAPFFVKSSHIALYQAYLLLPVMGIGGFLIPRFFGLPNREEVPESRKLPGGWLTGAAFAGFCGLLILASIVFESLGELRWGYGLRACGVLLYFSREVPVYAAKFKQGALVLAMRVSLFSIPAGYVLTAVWPHRQPAFIHVVFISGFSLLTFTVASRVILGHSGQSRLFRARLKSVYWMVGLVVLAMLTRVSADWMPAIRMSHLGYAAVAWVIGVVIWSCTLFRFLGVEDVE